MFEFLLSTGDIKVSQGITRFYQHDYDGSDNIVAHGITLYGADKVYITVVLNATDSQILIYNRLTGVFDEVYEVLSVRYYGVQSYGETIILAGIEDTIQANIIKKFVRNDTSGDAFQWNLTSTLIQPNMSDVSYSVDYTVYQFSVPDDIIFEVDTSIMRHYHNESYEFEELSYFNDLYDSSEDRIDIQIYEKDDYHYDVPLL